MHCEHALPPTAPLSGLGRIYLPGQPCSPRLQGSLAHPAHSLMRIVNNASSLRACITPTAPTFQGSLARPACMVALLTLLALLQGSLAHPAHSLMHIVNNASSLRTCITPTAPLSGLGSIYLPGQPCSPRLHGSLAHPARSLAG